MAVVMEGVRGASRQVAEPGRRQQARAPDLVEGRRAAARRSPQPERKAIFFLQAGSGDAPCLRVLG